MAYHGRSAVRRGSFSKDGYGGNAGIPEGLVPPFCGQSIASGLDLPRPFLDPLPEIAVDHLTTSAGEGGFPPTSPWALFNRQPEAHSDDLVGEGLPACHTGLEWQGGVEPWPGVVPPLLTPEAYTRSSMDERANKVNIFYDQLLIKEPGTVKRTPWHYDMPYWPLVGWQVCTI